MLSSRNPCTVLTDAVSVGRTLSLSARDACHGTLACRVIVCTELSTRPLFPYPATQDTNKLWWRAVPCTGPPTQSCSTYKSCHTFFLYDCKLKWHLFGAPTMFVHHLEHALPHRCVTGIGRIAVPSVPRQPTTPGQAALELQGQHMAPVSSSKRLNTRTQLGQQILWVDCKRTLMPTCNEASVSVCVSLH